MGVVTCTSSAGKMEATTFHLFSILLLCCSEVVLSADECYECAKPIRKAATECRPLHPPVLCQCIAAKLTEWHMEKCIPCIPEYVPGCRVPKGYKDLAARNYTTNMNAVAPPSEEGEAQCFVVQTGPYGNKRDVSTFFTDEPRAMVNGDEVQQISSLFIQSGDILDGFIANYMPGPVQSIFHGGNGGSRHNVLLNGEKINYIQGQFGQIFVPNSDIPINAINQLLLSTDGGNSYGPFGNLELSPFTPFEQHAPCKGGYLWYFSGYQSSYNIGSDVGTYIDQLLFNWKCCNVSQCN